LPRQLAQRGDRLVFSNGIIVLAAAAAGLLVAFGGLTNALIPLYAVGVFTSFTFSQWGMVRHHLRLREAGWRRSSVLNAIGAVAAGPEDAEKMQKRWSEQAIRVPLETVISPALELTEATLGFLDELERRWVDGTITVLIPELFVEHWWQHLLHNQSALILKA